MITILLKVLTVEWEGRNFWETRVRTTLGIICVSIEFLERQLSCKGIILKIWGLTSLFTSLFSFPPLPICTHLLYCLFQLLCFLAHLPHYFGHHTQKPWARVQLMEPIGSHLLEITRASSAVIKLIFSCYFSISNHSRKTEFPLLNTGKITLGSVDDLSKDFPRTAKWLMAYPSAHKTNVWILVWMGHITCSFQTTAYFLPK